MIFFVSDLHLGLLKREDDKQREDNFLKFLEIIEPSCEKLYLVGDIFDYWFEYKTVTPKYFYRTLTALHKFKESGIEIEYLMGNHDFGHKDFFKKELGIEIISNDIVREHSGKKFYIAHGDGKAENDRGYLILRAILRNKVSNWLYRIIHPDIGIKVASSSSKSSRSYTDSKEYGREDGLLKFAKSKLKEGFDYVIMGHRHKKMEVEHSGGLYLNLGEWIKDPAYAVFDGEKLQLKSVKELIES